MLVVSCAKNYPEPSGFLGEIDQNIVPEKRLPFGKSWKAPEVDLRRFGRVEVAPVGTDQVRALGWGIDGASERNFDSVRARDIAEIAVYTEKQLRKYLPPNDYQSSTLTTPKLRTSKALRLETNLVEVVPGKPAAQALENWLPFVAIVNRPTLALEGRFVDAETGQVVFAFSDRERAEISLYDAQKFTYYGVHRREAKRWAKQLASVLRRNAEGTTNDAFPIQPITW